MTPITANSTDSAAPAQAKPEIIPATAPAQLNEIAVTLSTANLLNDLRAKPGSRGSTVVYVEHTSTRLTPAKGEAIPATQERIQAPVLIETAPPAPVPPADPAAETATDMAAVAPASAGEISLEPPTAIVANFGTGGSVSAAAVPARASLEATGPIFHRETVARVDLVSTQEYVVGLELGTAHVRCAIAECLKDSLRVLAYSETPAYGVTLGEVVDLQRASETAKRVMRNCAQQANMSIHSTFVGLKGLHLDYQPVAATYALPGGRDRIEAGDVKKLRKQLENIGLPEDRTKIELLPQRYLLEGGQRTGSPIGLAVPSFSAHAQVVTAGARQLANIEHAIKRVGVYPEQWRMSVTAAALSCTSADERNLGVTVIDFGAGSTAAAFYQNGELRAARLFSFSGNELTDNLMRKFRLSKASAEAAKVRFGGASVAALMAAGADEKIPVITADGDGRRQLQRSEMVAAVEEAVDEFIRKFCVWLEENSKAGLPGAAVDLSAQLPAGVVLIGGGALLTDLTDKLSARLNVPARVGKPLYLRATPDIVAQMNTPEACCLHGLLTSAAQSRQAELPEKAKGVLARVWQSFKRLAEEF